MTKTLAIDADVTAALDRWAGAIGTPDHQAASEALDALLVELCSTRMRTPEPYDVPEAKDMLALFKLAAMDGYNKKPISTVEEWVEECKKRMLLLYLAGRRHAGAKPDQRRDDDERVKWSRAEGIVNEAAAALEVEGDPSDTSPRERRYAELAILLVVDVLPLLTLRATEGRTPTEAPSVRIDDDALYPDVMLVSAIDRVREGVATEGTSLTVDQCIALRDYIARLQGPGAFAELASLEAEHDVTVGQPPGATPAGRRTQESERKPTCIACGGAQPCDCNEAGE